MPQSQNHHWAARFHAGKAYRSFGQCEKAKGLFRKLLLECGDQDIRERAWTEIMKLDSKADVTIPGLRKSLIE